MEQMYLEDFAHSSERPEAVFSSKPVWYRLASRLARLASPVLKFCVDYPGGSFTLFSGLQT